MVTRLVLRHRGCSHPHLTGEETREVKDWPRGAGWLQALLLTAEEKGILQGYHWALWAPCWAQGPHSPAPGRLASDFACSTLLELAHEV